MVGLTAIEKISNGHGSFAIWREGDITDLSIIKERNKDLHGRIIFIGYNASGYIPPFKNFHSSHRGGRDSWLADSIGKHPHLRGAYMTDFFKGDYAPRETGVEINSEIIQKNLEILKQEIALFKDDNSVLVAFGDKTHKLLAELGFEAEYLPHYARRGLTREKFIVLVQELGKKPLRSLYEYDSARGSGV
jgi:hypothetical protein